MKVHLHDHSGHIFTADLARRLAERGHEVVFGYSAQFESPHGRMAADPAQASRLQIRALSAAVPFSKYSPRRRVRYELSYAKSWRAELEREPADVVVACNVPLFTLARMRRWFGRTRQPWVLWHQDIYSRAIADEARRVLPGPAAGFAAARLLGLERAQVASAGAVLAIGDAFVAEYRRWGVRTDHVHVLANWAPVDEVRPGLRDNDWATAQELPAGPLRLMYAGTIGRKHNPALLVTLLDAVRERGVDAILVVASEGDAAADLAAANAARDDVRVLPFQPAEQVSDMLASADVCVALLEPSAAEFSVPSKILSYLCAGRPTVALVPASNAAATEVAAAGGFAAAPTDAGANLAADWIIDLCADGDRRDEVAAAARAHAQDRYALDRIVDTFEQVLLAVASGARATSRIR